MDPVFFGDPDLDFKNPDPDPSVFCFNFLYLYLHFSFYSWNRIRIFRIGSVFFGRSGLMKRPGSETLI